VPALGQQHKHGLDIESNGLRSNKAARHPVSADVATFAALASSDGRNNPPTVKAIAQAERWVRPPIQQGRIRATAR